MTTKSRTVWVACDPEGFEGATQLPITLFEASQPKTKPFIPGPSWTLGKEVDAALLDWYSARGQPVPPDELGIGATIDAANATEEAVFAAATAAAEEELPSVVPPYGTPEFWDYHKKKKELENKRRAAEGLPPLPTKKELEAEKEKARKEKEAAKAAAEAEKEKARKEKEAKKAEKEAEKAAKAAKKAAKAAKA
jgi:hypothetical protein